MTYIQQGLNSRSIPIIGDDIYQVGQVFRILDQPCTPNVTIAVQALFSYTPTLIWTLLKPTPFDLATDRFLQRHKKRRYKYLFTELADRVPALEEKQVRTAVFHLGAIAERIGWYMIVADATTDFALNWTSMAYQWAGCRTPNPTWARNWGDMGFAVEPFVPMPYTYPVLNSLAAGNAVASGTALTLTKTGPYSITWTGVPVITPYFGQTGHVSELFLEVEINDSENFRVEATKQILEDGTEEWSAVWSDLFTIEKKVTVRPQVSWTAGRFTMTNQELQIHGGKATGLEHDP